MQSPRFLDNLLFIIFYVDGWVAACMSLVLLHNHVTAAGSSCGPFQKIHCNCKQGLDFVFRVTASSHFSLEVAHWY